jgi:copper homeostasis protein
MQTYHGPVTVEVCVGSVADAQAAAVQGADRIELCSALELGGLTPSEGLVETVMAACDLPIVAMLRPRAGGFLYGRHEFAAMLRDAERFLRLGVRGLVFGVLDARRDVDANRTKDLIECAGGAESVFHRAIDFVADPRKAIDQLASLGCTRVLTSGGASSAALGAANIAEYQRLAGGRIQIMPGGGVNATNVVDLLRLTGCAQVHVGASGPHSDSSIGDTDIELCDARFLRGSSYRAVVSADLAATMSAVRRQSP